MPGTFILTRGGCGIALMTLLASPALADNLIVPSAPHIVVSPATFLSQAVLNLNAEVSVPNIGNAVAEAFSAPSSAQSVLGAAHTGAAAGDVAGLAWQGWVAPSGG